MKMTIKLSKNNENDRDKEMVNLDYYGAKDIQEITGCKKTFAYELIRKLQNSFKKEYPNVITIQGRIPKWYFEKTMINKKGD